MEHLILSSLLFNDQYLRKVLPFLKAEYFESSSQRIVFEEIRSFVEKYNQPATKEILCIEVEKRSSLNDTEYKELLNLIGTLSPVEAEQAWLIAKTEKWCKDRAIYLALMESIHIADGNNEKKSRDSIPSILSDALAVSFDNHIGHDYLEDYENRFEFYTRKEEKIPFDIEYLNKITKGGISKKTMTIVMASSGVGKSLYLCHIASSTLLQGKNVLYITLEMSEERIAERIDANLLDVNIADFGSLPKSTFDNKVSSLSKKTQGKLIIKEYPTSSAHVGHFKALLEDLKLKKSFVPDLLIVDYMNICSSSKYKGITSANSYVIVKSIAEELRGLAVEYNLPLVTATQTNRCLGLNTIVTKKNGESIEIQNIQLGDEILSHSGYVKVEHIFPIEEQEVYEITTKSGKKIVCSEKHIFPTVHGEKNLLNGLCIGDILFVKDVGEDPISYVQKIEKQKTIDITVSGDNLFFANDILTHNSGINNSDVELTDISDSTGGLMTADLLFALISTEELENLGQIMVKQLKNRYSSIDRYRRFVVGIDRAKMRLYDVEQSAQDGILDKGAQESYDYEERKPKKSFQEFKF